MPLLRSVLAASGQGWIFPQASERGRNTGTSRLPSLVRPAITTLKLTHTNLGNRGGGTFSCSLQVRSVECAELSGKTTETRPRCPYPTGRSGLFAGVEGFQDEFGPVVEMLVAADL